ncbi:MAG: acyl-ACP--UDP-N-acetylglucosamine O-acyltransferase [Halanaerobiaceae bacterium]
MRYYDFANIHETAVIHSGARLGENVEIGPYSVIGENVEIGAGTTIGSYTQIEGWTQIGEQNRIFDEVSIGLPPQHLEYEGEKTFLHIGDNNIIREYVTIHRGTVDGGGETRIGNNNFLKAYSHVAHDCNLGNNITLSNSANLGGHVTVENNAFISQLVGIHQFVKIGELSRIESHSKLIKDLPPYIKAKGHPAQVVSINHEGLEKEGLSSARKQEIQKAYKILYKSDYNITQAIEIMDQELQTSGEVEHLMRFLKSSTRGICR